MATSPRPLAVVTGGSNGIGLELARELASRGHDLLIAAEDRSHLEEAARELGSAGGQVEIHSADLATEQGVDGLCRALAGRQVDVLCVNAGVGLGGPFVETDLQRELRMIDLNVRGAVQLTKSVLKGMVARNKGRILFTSSVAATMPDPYEAVYGGTKVFLRWFGQALRDELRGTAVTVTVLMPSMTETNFFKRAEMMDTKAGTTKKDAPEVVAKAGVDALLAGKDRVIPTVKNKLLGGIADSLPDPLAAKAHRSLSEPGSANKSSSKAPAAIGVAAAGLGIALFAGWRNRQSDGQTRPTQSPERNLQRSER